MEYWKYHDSKMKELKQLYNRISKQTQNRLQEIFDSFNIEFSDLYSIVDNKTKKRINSKIEGWKDNKLLSGYFGTLANSIYNRTRVKNSEIIELLIYGAYIEEQSKLQQKELNIFREDVNYYYEQGQKETKAKDTSIITDAIFLALLAEPNYSGLTYEQYIQTMLLYNANQIYKQTVINIQQKKPLEINSSEYQNILNTQQKQKINIKDNKISGAVDLQLIGMNNKAKAEGMYKFDKNAKVRFIAVKDNKTTKMCTSLDGQIFYVHDWNEFYRYTESGGNKKIKCYGLIQGLNLPPINDHFHWCRSTIVYCTDISNVELIAEYNDIKSKAKELIIEIPDTVEEFAKLWYNKDGYAEEIKIKRKIYNDYKRQVEFGKEGERATFDKYYNNYLQTLKVGKIVTKDNIEVGVIKPHTIYRLASRDLTVEDIVNILNNSDGKLDTKHNSLLYTLDKRIVVSIANDENHNIKTIMKRRK